VLDTPDIFYPLQTLQHSNSKFNSLRKVFIMSFVSRCFQGFLVSTLSVPAYAAETVPSPAAEQAPKPAAVDASNLVEVVQVLSLANRSQLDNIALVGERNPADDLQLLAADLERDHRWMQDTLDALARRKNIGLEVEDLTPTSLQVKRNVDVDYQTLAQKPQEEFRATFLRLTIYQYQKILKLYDQIDRLNSDERMKVAISVFRPLIQKARADTMKLQDELIQAL
jgi:predicted outer membrane protein